MSRVAISLPDDLLLAVEKERRTHGITRSELFRRAVTAFLQRQREREAIDDYVAGYRNQPETDEELAWLSNTSREVMAANPWSEDDRG